MARLSPNFRVPESGYARLELGYDWMSSALKALSFARKLMQNTWISMFSIQSIPSIILAKVSGSRVGSGRSDVHVARLGEWGGGGCTSS